MLQFYSVKYIIFDKEKNKPLCSWVGWRDICTNETLSHESIDLTWDNVYHYGSLMHGNLNPQFTQRKKGRVFKCGASFEYENYTFKEWKRPELNLEYRTEYTLTTKSIQEVLEYGDSDKAIQYLIERGLAVTNIDIGGIKLGIR